MDLPHLVDLAEQIADADAARMGVTRYASWHLLRLQDEAQDLSQSWVELSGQRGFDEEGRRKEAFSADLLDVLVELLVLAKEYDVDLAAEAERRAANLSELTATIYDEPAGEVAAQH